MECLGGAIPVEFDRADLHPGCMDAAGREHVSHVWVDGELLLQDRVLTRIDTTDILAKARAWKARIQP